MVYRRQKDSDTWHWCRNCSNWPESDYVEQKTKPTSGELDAECKSRNAAGTCRKSSWAPRGYSRSRPRPVDRGLTSSRARTRARHLIIS